LGRFIKNRGWLSIGLKQDDDFMAAYGLILAVADGVGGAAGGTLASRLALTAFERQFYGVEKSGNNLESYIEALQGAAARANEGLLALATKRPELSGFGCTLSGVCLTPMGYLVFNAGDSRVYHFRSGILKLLTKDDSVTALAVAAGQLTPEEAELSPVRHTLTNCVGSHSFHLAIHQGMELPDFIDQDLILICSDGLHDLVSHDELEKILSISQTEDLIATKLVEQAISQGGHDNISVILIRAIEKV